MRITTVAAAQMRPIQRADSRDAVVARMIALKDEARCWCIHAISTPRNSARQRSSTPLATAAWSITG